MSHEARDSRTHWARRSVLGGWWRSSRIRLAIVALCCLAVAGVAIPAMSLTSRLLANSGFALGRTSPNPGLASLTRGSSSAVPSPATGSSSATGSCSDLYFISARGSGQTDKAFGAKHPNITKETTDQTVSPQTDSVWMAIQKQLQSQGIELTGKGAKVSSTFYQLPYPAPSTKVLFSGLTNPLKSTNQITATVKDYRQFRKNLPAYIAGEQKGESLLYADLARIYHDCSSAGVQPMVVLAGYSQGAMVVHNILNTIASSGQTGFASMIKGAVLIADPERMPYSDVTNFGTAAPGDYGLCRAVDILPHLPHTPVAGSCVPPGMTTDVAASFSAVAYQVCDKDDVFCDTSGLFKSRGDIPSFTNLFAFMTDVHLGGQTHSLSYTGGEIRTAGRRVARSLVLDGLGTQQSPTPSPSPSTSASSTSGSWTAAEAPLPADAPSNASAVLQGVTCGSAGSCVAVGYEAVPNVPGQTALIETLNGTTWTASMPPLPSQLAQVGVYSTDLNSVTCASATSCVAVGQYEDDNSNIGALIDTLNGGTWTAAVAPLPAGGSDAFLDSISCTSASYCVAVGSYQPSNTSEGALIETLNGGTWTGIEGPAPTGAGSPELSSVSCGATGFCAAVGTYMDTIGVIETLNVGGWTAETEPMPVDAISNPSDGQGVGLDSVACPSAGSCIAVGSYLTSQGSDQGVLEEFSSGTWTAAEAPLPADADTSRNTWFGSVACSSAASCLVVGGYNLDNNQYTGVLDTLTGGKWTAVTAPNGDLMSSAACATQACVAVAAYGSATGIIDSNFTGTWTEASVSPANANGTGPAGFDRASCLASGKCVAVGTYTDTTGSVESMIVTNS